MWDTATDGTLAVSVGRSELRGQENVELNSTSDIISYRETPVATMTQNYLNLQFEQLLNNHQVRLRTDYSQYRRSETYKIQTFVDEAKFA